MHESITHNMLRLLECGAFGTIEGKALRSGMASPLQAMSAHKWRELFRVAEGLHVLPYVASGAEQLRDMRELTHTLFELLDDPTKTITLAEPDVSEVQLYNVLTSHRLVAIIEEEEGSWERSEETLMLLKLIVLNADAVVTRGVSIEGVIALGNHVRCYGEAIDYTKLGEWLGKLGLVRMASMLGNVLVEAMYFSEEELPFVIRPYRGARDLFVAALQEWEKKKTCGMATRMRVAPVETVSHRFVKAISIVTDIEE